MKLSQDWITLQQAYEEKLYDLWRKLEGQISYYEKNESPWGDRGVVGRARANNYRNEIKKLIAKPYPSWKDAYSALFHKVLDDVAAENGVGPLETSKQLRKRLIYVLCAAVNVSEGQFYFLENSLGKMPSTLRDKFAQEENKVDRYIAAKKKKQEQAAQKQERVAQERALSAPERALNKLCRHHSMPNLFLAVFKEKTMFATDVEETINNYLKYARTYNHTLFGATFNLWKRKGIKRAEDYLRSIAELKYDDNKLVTKIYEDVTNKKGILGSSQEFREYLMLVLFKHLGMTEAQVGTFKAQQAGAALASVAHSPVGSYGIIDMHGIMCDQLKKMMLHKGYALSSPMVEAESPRPEIRQLNSSW